MKTLLGTDERSRIQFSDEFDGDGDALFKACAEQELEGIVSKHALAPYRSGRSNLAQDQVLHGVALCGDRRGSRSQERSAQGRCLLTRTVRAGAAFIALSGDDRPRLFAELERLATSWAAFKSSRLMDVKWCHPKLVVEVKHLAKQVSPPRHGKKLRSINLEPEERRVSTVRSAMP